jgi:hypothetical protein
VRNASLLVLPHKCIRELMAYRTASYAEARRQLTPKADEGTVSPVYLGATAKSQSFFRKMGESHQEAERLRQQCRSAANSSAARNTEEKVDLQHIKNTISQARAVSSYAQDIITHDTSHRMQKFSDAGAPMWLGHLAEPKHFETKAVSAGPSGLPDPSPRSEANLPGAVEPYQARDDYSKQISEALLSDRTDCIHSKDPEASKPSPGNAGDIIGQAEAAKTQDIQSPEAAAEVRGIKEESLSGRGSAVDLESDKEVLDDSSEEDDESVYDDSEASDAWPPSPPVLRFKMRMQFSRRFKPSSEDEKALIEEMNKDLNEKYLESISRKIDHPSVVWLNERFAMNIETEHTFEVGFPIIILTMLDAIYPKRVRWREVDWRHQYKRSLLKNYNILERMWAEVNMDKAKEFRVENTPLRLENLPTTSLAEKLEFLRLMKRWYDQRIHHAGPYDPMAKRLEFLEQCRGSGHTVKFPHWIRLDKDHKVEVSEADAREQKKTQEYNKMPEFKRLIHFLGCQDFQTM